MMEIERAHARIDEIEKSRSAQPLVEALARISKLEDEIKAMKARMGKREPAEI